MFSQYCTTECNTQLCTMHLVHCNSSVAWYYVLASTKGLCCSLQVLLEYTSFMLPHFTVPAAASITPLFVLCVATTVYKDLVSESIASMQAPKQQPKQQPKQHQHCSSCSTQQLVAWLHMYRCYAQCGTCLVYATAALLSKSCACQQLATE
jgi:hypothetical protein